MTKKKDNTSNDKVIMQDIIDNLNEKNRVLESRIVSLQEQLETAYGVNAGLQEQLDNEEDYDTLTKLHTLLLIFMGLTRNFCKDSELGGCIENAIENYYVDMAKALAKRTNFGFGRKKEDGSTDDNNYDEDFGEDEEEEYQ